MSGDFSEVSVLIVDDSPIVRRAVRKAVLSAGVDEASIREAENGRVALDALDVDEPDIVLLDINMPVMDGEQFLEELDASGRTDRVLVVIVSTEMNAKRLLRLAGLGAKARLRKPFQPEDLRDTMVDILAKRRSA